MLFRYLGYYESAQELELAADLTFNVDLEEEEVKLEEVIISGERADLNVTSVEMSTNRLKMKTVQKMPALLGEVDMLGSMVCRFQYLLLNLPNIFLFFSEPCADYKHECTSPSFR